ncbi:ABC transporter ATP-binding protein [Terrarubrum flagellatum]|uniref:ABC transporter ATP-binding protein n=1 Tax=Terrirubrum flagellatum TaxID=2895980 RepID=UPI0031453924
MKQASANHVGGTSPLQAPAAQRDTSTSAHAAPRDQGKQPPIVADAEQNSRPLVEFVDVEKAYGSFQAVRNLNLHVGRGEFLTFLGPSGSGKTTTLNMLAGFERPTRGVITLEGKSVERLPPYERNIGMVFQNYALFPHMSVEENVAFPLSVRKTPKAEIAPRVKRALEMVRLEQFGDRKPAQLSGGQQQRVALARALVFKPSLVLMDEPLGALDKKLREHMQIELKQIHETLGVTIVYVTHDQSEALTMSDRVAVFEGGVVVQIGSPDTLYNEPATPFVAEFIGENNLLDGEVAKISGVQCLIALSGGKMIIANAADRLSAGDAVKLAIRPERISVSREQARSENCVEAIVDGRIYLGDHQRLLARLENGDVLTVKIGPEGAPPSGEKIQLSWNAVDSRAFTAGVAAPRNISASRREE